MKIKQTLKKQLDFMYNDHIDSALIKDLRLIDQCLELVDQFPNEFSLEVYSFNGYRRTWQFRINRLGYLPELLKQLKWKIEYL